MKASIVDRMRTRTDREERSLLNGPFTVTFRCVDARATRSVPRDSGYSVARPRFQYPMNDMSVFGTPGDSAAGPAGNVASPCEETSPATCTQYHSTK